MTPPGANVVLVRHGEINTKSANVQHSMERRLVSNLAALLDDRGIDGTVEKRWTRPLIFTDESEVEAATDAATDAPGVVSASPALRVDPDVEAVEDALARTAAEKYDGGTYAVDANRADKSLPFTSEDVERRGGAAVAEVVDVEATVDLDDPDHTFYVEIRDDDAYVFTEKRDGPGGLPLGSQSRLVALVSGGIDSPVATFEVMRRGAPVVPVYADLGDFGGPDHRARAIETVRDLARHAPNFEMTTWVVPFGDLLSDLADRMEQGRMIAFRRALFVAAEEVADRTGAHGIVTGEAIGQKSSQTAMNLGITSRATDLAIHRPLVSADKSDVTQRAREVGTFDDSTIPAGCNRFAPDQPETRANQRRQREREPDDLLERARGLVDEAERVDPRG